MKRLYLLRLAAVILCGSAPVQAQQKTLKEINWSELAKAGQLTQGTVVNLPDKKEALKIENAGPEPLQATVLILEKPGINESFYMVRGEVRYDDVAGDGYLEMWNHFGEAAYFSRTMGDVGPMAKLKGTSDWRPFILPFNASGADGKATKLVINVILPGKGTVYLRGVTLSETKKTGAAGASADPATPGAGAWWTTRTAGIIGAVGGTLLGCVGGLMEWCAARGKSRAFVVVTSRVLIGMGAVAVALGAIAAAVRQPYPVWYALLLPGLLCVLIFPFRLRRYLEQYQRLELRRMSAIDAT
jgi:hypothetical protein